MGWLGNLLGRRQRHSDRWHKTGQVVRNRQLSGRRSIRQWVGDTAGAGIRHAGTQAVYHTKKAVNNYRARQYATGNPRQFGMSQSDRLDDERGQHLKALRGGYGTLTTAEYKRAERGYQRTNAALSGRSRGKSRTRRVTNPRRRAYKPYAPRRRYARRSRSLGPW
jgi:hypothetical protein